MLRTPKLWWRKGALPLRLLSTFASRDSCGTGVTCVPAQLPHLGVRRVLQISCKAKKLQNLDGVPSHVDLPPLQTMPAGVLEGVVIVVPSFTKGKNPHQPVVHGDVTSVPILETPHVAHGVHGPRHMPCEDHPGEEAPKHKRQASPKIQPHDRQHDGMNGVCLLQESVVPLLGQVLGIAPVHPHPGSLLIQKPARMGPPETILGRVNVIWRVSCAVVVTMRRHPVDGMALHGEGPAVSQDVLNNLW
mmetsp:Transcript_127068/g.301821  ORF Transcript_127068/g.301821 Transcript_127068/m.301821 type:complete len:246 (+) Transcript_127068:187-924(+)